MSHTTDDAKNNCILILAAAGIGCLALGDKMQEWQLALGVTTVVLIFWINWGRPFLRKRRMKKPFRVFWGGAQSGLTPLEKRVPAHSQVDVQLRVEPLIDYKEEEIVFGFLGDKNARPEPKSFSNSFIREGKRKEGTPADTESHYIDEHGRYHINLPRERTAGNTYTLGFKVQTGAPGKYDVALLAITDGGDSRPKEDLWLIVEEPTETSSEEKTVS